MPTATLTKPPRIGRPPKNKAETNAPTAADDREERQILRFIPCRRSALSVPFQKAVDAQRRKKKNERLYWLQAAEGDHFCRAVIIATPTDNGPYAVRLFVDLSPCSYADQQWARGLIAEQGNGGFAALPTVGRFVVEQISKGAK